MERWEELVHEHRHFGFFWLPSEESAELYNLDTHGRTMTDQCYVKIYDEPGDDEPDSAEEGRRIDRCYRIYPMVYDPNFHELEYFVPLERGPDALHAMRELMLAQLPESVYPLEVRTVGPDDAHLSPHYRTATTVISVSGKPGTDYWDYLRTVDALLAEFDARVHWGKLHFLTRERLLDALSRGRRLHPHPPPAGPRGRLPQRPPASAVRLGPVRTLRLGRRLGEHLLRRDLGEPVGSGIPACEARTMSAAVERTCPAISIRARSAWRASASVARPPARSARRRASSGASGSSKARASAQMACPRSATASARSGTGEPSRAGNAAPRARARACCARRSRGCGPARPGGRASASAGRRSGATRAVSRPERQRSRRARARRRPAAGPLERALGGRAVARAQRLRELVEHAPEPGEHRVGGAPDVEQRVGREEQQVDAEGDRAADQRLDRAHREQAERRGLGRADDDRRDAGLGHEQRPAAEQDRGGHGERDHQGDLRGARPDEAHETVGDEHAEHDAAGQLEPRARAAVRPSRPGR